MSNCLLQTEGGSAAKTVTLNKPAAVDPLSLALRDHLRSLRRILPVISGAVTTLRRQNADFDADVAYGLAEQACEPLDYKIARVESLLAYYARQHQLQEAYA